MDILRTEGAVGIVDRPEGGLHRRLDTQNGGVAVVVRSVVRARGECSCGRRGSRRVLPAMAVHDTLLHAATKRCQPAVPLVL
jgi:hypothetical protein